MFILYMLKNELLRKIIPSNNSNNMLKILFLIYEFMQCFLILYNKKVFFNSPMIKTFVCLKPCSE